MPKFEEDGTCIACRDAKCTCGADETYLARGSINNKDCRLIICDCCNVGEEYPEAPPKKEKKRASATV